MTNSEHWKAAIKSAEEGYDSNPAGSIYAQALFKMSEMVGIGDGTNKAEYIPSKEEMDEMTVRIKQFLNAEISGAELKQGYSGSRLAIMQWAEQIAEQRGL